MTKAEVAAVIKMVVASYPNYDKFRDRTEVENTVNLWAVMFSDDSRDIVTLAVKRHIATNKWPPSIAEIREIIAQIQHPELVPPDTAWSAVADLLYSEGEYFSGDLYKRLPPLVARVVETIGWRTLWEMGRGYTNKPGMNRVAFLQLYTPAYERAKRDAMLPAGIAEESAAAQRSLNNPSIQMLEAATQSRREKERVYDDIDRRGLFALPEGEGA